MAIDPIAARQAAVIALDRDVAETSRSAFMRMRPRNLQASFVEDYLPAVRPDLERAQAAAARIAGGTVARHADVPLVVNPAGFAGHSAAGGTLAGELARPLVGVYHDLDIGLPVDEALRRGANSLDVIVTNEIHDAARAAEQVQMTSVRAIEYYVRVIEPGACGKCIILAGRKYRYSKGFPRHEQCRCHMLALTDATQVQSPDEIYRGLTPEQRIAAFGVNGSKAIDDGADIYKVVNSTTVKKNHSTRGPGTTITDGEGRVLRGVGIRKGPDGVSRFKLVPESIYRIAVDAHGQPDRDEAFRLLKLHGYITPQGTLARVKRVAADSRRVADETARETARAARAAAKAAEEAAAKAAAALAEREAAAEAARIAEEAAAPARAAAAQAEARAAAAAQRKADTAALRARTDEQLGDDLTAAFEADDEAEIERLTVELDRRDAAAAKAAEKRERDKVNAQLRRDAVKAQQAEDIGRLISEGWNEYEAVEEITGVTIRQQKITEALGLLRRSGFNGRSFEAALKEKYYVEVAEEEALAEEYCRGADFRNAAGIRANIDPGTLFVGTDKWARDYAGQELRQFWDDRGGRLDINQLREELIEGRHRGTGKGDFNT